jgi:hypothetical protein
LKSEFVFFCQWKERMCVIFSCMHYRYNLSHLELKEYFYHYEKKKTLFMHDYNNMHICTSSIGLGQCNTSSC